MAFEPIAIVGRACVLPGALDPAALWSHVRAGHSLLGHAPAGRWRLDRALAMGRVGDSQDRTWTDVGGYVTGFERVFDPTGFSLPADEVRALDPVFQWVLHGVRESLRDARREVSPRTGLVLGNLSFPSSSMAAFAEQTWLSNQEGDVAKALAAASGARVHARNRFSSSLPAHLAAKALGLGGGSFALDAACASSLYALKLACDRLHDGTADTMVAGAVSAADDLFIHVGFCALSAMSRTGQSRPFHRDADGLVPAEGAAFVVLRRLSDAVASGEKILGVVRGVGLSNDGRGRGLLVPSEEGQLRAMRQAWQGAGLEPKDIGLVECHATGTSVGDATEVRSMAQLFGDAREVPIGSLKSNLGHLITAAGVAGVIKMLEAFEAGERPPTLNAEEPVAALAGTPFRLVTKAEPWTGPRRAAVSAFGFGGNNAHVIVEPYDPRVAFAVGAQLSSAPVAVVAVGARVGEGRDRAEFTRSLFAGTPDKGPRTAVEVDAEGLRFPPRDLEQTLPQQLLMLEAAREAVRGVVLPRDRTAVLVGMECDPEIPRYGARWRATSWATEGASGALVDPAWLANVRDGFSRPLEAAGVVGTMPNMPANRLNSQLDVAALGFTVASGETSGMTALQLAARALRAGEIDAAIVGATDLSHGEVHAAALRELGIAREAGDAAVALVLKRVDDARRDGDPVLALLGHGELPESWSVGQGTGAFDATELFGHAHAASGLVQVAAAALAVAHRVKPRVGATGLPWMGERAATVKVSALEAGETSVVLRGAPAQSWWGDAALTYVTFSGQDRREVLAALAADRRSDAGPARLVVTGTEGELPARREQARRWLEAGGPPPEGVAFRERPVAGELAFVFTGAAAGYQGMGRDLVLAFPSLVEALERRSSEVVAATRWAYEGGARHPLDQLWGTSFLCQLHAHLTRDVLKLAPHAVIGYSSGESNALFAMGAWNDLDAMIRESREGTIFTHELGGEFAAVRRVWSRLGHEGRWAAHTVAAPVEQVRAALAGEPLVHLTIVNAPDDCVIGGEAVACARVVARIGAARAMALDYELAAHCPEVEEIRQPWRALHRRETRDVGVRFYSNATGRSYVPTADAAADAITGQAVGTLDFPRTILQAWEDGVRVFVEHGPRGACTGWIRKILGEREHVVVSLDVYGRSAVRQAAQAVATLLAAGVPVDAKAFFAGISAATPSVQVPSRTLKFPAHLPPVRLPRPPEAGERMAPAPRLPSMLEDLLANPPRVLASADVDEPPAPRPVTVATVALAASRASPEIIAQAAALHSQLAVMHRETLAQQASLHTQFLALQQAMQQQFLGHRTRFSGSSPIALPPAPVRAPVPVVLPPAPPTPVRSAPPPPIMPSTPKPVSRVLPGPKFDRAQLETLASGRISSLFGPQFAAQDGYLRQVRMPMPPLLLADRVTGIDAVPVTMKTGTIWTETDVRADSWYLGPDGRMPGGIMIESGQADLLLISWLGADLENRGERVYRLLGCELTYHGSLPKPGETLVYDIHVDGHAQQGDVRMFFFHYDCQVNGERRLSVRHGQAGFFTDAELAASGGVLWAPEEETIAADAPFATPPLVTKHRRFSREQLVAFSEGRAADCFGEGFEATLAHVRAPRIAGGRMLLPDEVVTFDPAGGPWQRGYLRAEQRISPEDWFFRGHFKNDPCMPGTVMFEGCLETMAIHLAALGYAIDRDGWRFEPVPDLKYVMRCRGQVTPTSRLVTYEVFVRELHDGPQPTLYADLLCTVDGLKAFHARRVGLRLVPDWPLDHWKLLAPPATQETGALVPARQLGGLVGHEEARPVAEIDGFRFDYASLLACAWGRPSAAFGPFYARFDSHRRVARLPGPPYHFMSRVSRIDARIGVMESGGSIEVEYDVPARVWYFAENGAPSMPLCVLMEAALQPCGWFASFVGCALSTDTDLLFRNLDGTCTMHAAIPPDAGQLRTKVRFESLSRTAGMIIVSYTVECFVGETRVYDMKTVFGFFPKEAFENQAGLPTTDAERLRFEAAGEFEVDLVSRPVKYCAGPLRLAGPMLLMLDRVTAFTRDGGRKGLGWLRAEKDVDPDEWFFKAHFFQDPVQPGSLGIEALTQLLQFFMLERGLAEGLENPRFEPLMTGRPLTWKYRGQVVPSNRRIGAEIEVVEIGRDELGPFAVADAWLWVDGKRIYQAKNLGMRIVAGAARPSEPREELLDPQRDTWLGDHRPTWTMPALPLMSMLDRLAGAAQSREGRLPTVLREVKVHRWVVCDGAPVRLRAEVHRSGTKDVATLFAWREAADAARSRFEPVADGTVSFEDPGEAPAPWPSPADAVAVDDPYASGHLFHGPAFQLLESLRMGAAGSSATLQPARSGVPRGALNQGLLDALTHGIPHDELWRWSKEIPRDVVAYPHRVAELRLFDRLPDGGEWRVEARFAGFDGSPRLPVVELQLHDGKRVVATMRLVEVLLPKGALGSAAPQARRAFLRDQLFVPGLALSRVDGGDTVLGDREVREVDWMPGNVARIYDVPAARRHELVAHVAVQEHVARRAFVHPADVHVAQDLGSAAAAMRPFRRHGARVARDADGVRVSDIAAPVADFSPVRAWWRERLGTGPWVVEDLFLGLIERFVGDVVVADPRGLAALRGRGCLFLANHQVGLESLLFSMIAPALAGAPLVTLAKAEHRETWIGRLIAQCFSYPGIVDPGVIAFFDRQDAGSLLGLTQTLGVELRAGKRHLMVHVEGTRALAARTPVTQVSGAFLDLALATDVPIVPVRFVGGLPVKPLAQRLDFPVDFGRQDIWIGAAIPPAMLAKLPLKERRDLVLAAINGLGPALTTEQPSLPDDGFRLAVEGWRRTSGASLENAVLHRALELSGAPCEESRALLGGRAGSDDARGRWLDGLARLLYGAR